jgi:hypothetical protein
MAFKPFSTYGEKDSFGQKTGRFLRKTFLRLAFLGAVGGPFYHHYGTKESIEAKITSVDTIPSDNKDAPVETIIHTDKGTFVNETTRMHRKDGEDVAALDKVLQPGATVRITVYGIDPRIGSVSLENLGIYRNITDAAPVTVVPPLSKPVTVVRTPVKPIETAIVPAAIEQDNEAPEVFAANADLTDMAQKLPQLYCDLQIMEQLPLTGKGVYDMLKDPANGIVSHLVPNPEGAAVDGGYSKKHAKIPRGSRTSTTFHEYFHALQDINGGGDAMFKLTMKDAVIDNLLQEASAVAYELASRQEAENRNLAFLDPVAKVTTLPGGVTMTSSTSSASDNPEIKTAFHDAYTAAWEQNASLDAQAREAKALEAGGQAAVRFLLEGKDATWSASYSQLAAANVNNNSQSLGNDGRENKPGYKDKRHDAYIKMGAVSSQINFIPEEYLGADADATIDKCFKDMGFTTTALYTAPAKAAPKTKPPMLG